MSDITWTNIKIKLGALRPWADNPRLSTKKQAERLLNSWKEFGQVETIAVDPEYSVLDGHQRLSALMTIYGPEYVVDARRSSRTLTDEERKKLVIYLHNSAVGSWDWDVISNWDASSLVDWGMDKDALKDWKRDVSALDNMLKSEEKEPVDAEPQIDRAAELNKKWQVKTGDLWQIGEHRLLCGDSTVKSDVERVMVGERANVCLTDPPYGLGNKKDSGKNDYDIHEDSRENLEILAKGWLPIAREISDCVVFSPGVTNAWIYPEANWIMCWFYGGGQLRSSWGYNCWQPFLCYGKDPSLATGHGGRPDAIDMNTPANGDDLDHPCPKPSKLWEWFIERLSFEIGEIFFDPFGGSGTSFVACENLHRKCRAIEISPNYCAVILERMATAFPELEIVRL